jgi:hypothetical protein
MVEIDQSPGEVRRPGLLRETPRHRLTSSPVHHLDHARLRVRELAQWRELIPAIRRHGKSPVPVNQ